MADHWYCPLTREPRHFVEKKDGSGTRPTTIADARKHGWLPSVTTILKSLHKEALVKWLCRNAAMAALTTPRREGEDLDAFCERVLAQDAEDESRKARDFGTDLHNEIEACLKSGKPPQEHLAAYVNPALAQIKELGDPRQIETIVVGDGYAGKMDLLCERLGVLTVTDFKTTKKLPRKSWPEHRLQMAAYAQALGNTGDLRIRTANIYISTMQPGEILVSVQDEWDRDWNAFRHLLEYWKIANDFEMTTK